MSLALIYSKIPKLPCKGLCQASCGPIMADPPEVAAFEATTGQPFPDPLKVLKSETLTCPQLNVLGKCSVYQHRPLICRLWGVVQEMRCPHGCEPSHWLTDPDARHLLDEVAELPMPERAIA